MNAEPAMACCPAGQGRDDRKSGAIAEAHSHAEPGARVAPSFAFAREVLRSSAMRQHGAGAANIKLDNPDHASVFFLDGDAHRKRRSAIAGFFAPKAIVTRHQPIMQRLMAEGSRPLDEMSFQMAVDVAAEIIGLTDSPDQAGLPDRLRRMLGFSSLQNRGFLSRLWAKAMAAKRAMDIIRLDLRPAVRARKAAPRDDVISYMVKEGYSEKSMLVECMTYGTAGMMTTREFIVMCAWHLFTNDPLRERFLSGSEDDQFAILEEILRLEPVAAVLHRRAAEAIAQSADGPVQEGEVIAIDIRLANTDEAITGPCPLALDPDRARRMKVVGSYMSFGDGAHRCPGSQVALHETRVFLDRLLRVPGIRLEREPEITWFAMIGSYELRGAIVSVDPAAA
ncbi:MAG TPA: cytochrome P450 [Novosphingobium sp.]|nr:cytochrome P450 [Novosphingobium sp.]